MVHVQEVQTAMMGKFTVFQDRVAAISTGNGRETGDCGESRDNEKNARFKGGRDRGTGRPLIPYAPARKKCAQ